MRSHDGLHDQSLDSDSAIAIQRNGCAQRYIGFAVQCSDGGQLKETLQTGFETSVPSIELRHICIKREGFDLGGGEAGEIIQCLFIAKFKGCIALSFPASIETIAGNAFAC